MKRYHYPICIILAALVLQGCFSVVRFSKLESTQGTRRWSEETQAYVWYPCTYAWQEDFLGQFGLYPTMQMRWQLLRLTWNWSPPQYYWSRRVALPLAWICMLPGGIVDLTVDTVALPWDWKYRGNCRDLVADELPEKMDRSVCVACGRLSEGDFALCHKKSDRKTPDFSKRYGVCPDCVQNVKTNGYYFAY